MLFHIPFQTVLNKWESILRPRYTPLFLYAVCTYQCTLCTQYLSAYHCVQYLSLYTLYAVPITLHSVRSTYHCVVVHSVQRPITIIAIHSTYLSFYISFVKETLTKPYNFRACYFSILGAEFFDRKFCSKQIVPTHSGPYHWTLMCTV